MMSPEAHAQGEQIKPVGFILMVIPTVGRG